MANKFLTNEQLQQFERDGYIILSGLFSEQEATELREHFMDIHAAGPVEGFNPQPLAEVDGDVLRAYPRYIHPHKRDALSMDIMLDSRFEKILEDLFGEPALAAQSMFYYKPPGGRGQALHQDNFYLTVAPGTCMAAWLAVEDIDPENGGLFVVPGSHQTDVQCPHVADMTKSFAIEEVDVPQGMTPIPTHMKAGDVLFFNGSLIHGSYPNQSKDRFRRSFICHYMPASSTQISYGYFPLYRFDGTAIEKEDGVVEAIDEGGFCGTEEWKVIYAARGSEVSLA